MSRRKRVFYVYMHNNTNSQDDEVYKVKAYDRDDARRVARLRQSWPGRFEIGRVISGRPKSMADKRDLRDLWWWSTDKTA